MCDSFLKHLTLPLQPFSIFGHYGFCILYWDLGICMADRLVVKERTFIGKVVLYRMDSACSYYFSFGYRLIKIIYIGVPLEGLGFMVGCPRIFP